MQVVYEYSKGNCVVELQVPCLSTDHRTRAADAGPLNTGTDHGQWAVGNAQSLLRNSTFQGLVGGVLSRFSSAAQFKRDLAANVEVIRTAPSAVPPPASLGLNGALRNTWSLADWAAYVDAVWVQLQVRVAVDPGGLTREVETPLPSNSPHDPMVLRVDLVGSHGRWKRPCLETAHMTLWY
jgi:hypothetical protein